MLHTGSPDEEGGAELARKSFSSNGYEAIPFGIVSAWIPAGYRVMDFQMNGHAEMENCYRVEVSGWDASEDFFVEKTMLHWGEHGDKDIRLRSSLREGCVVFVRVLQRFSNTDVISVAYQVARLSELDGEGCTIVRLAQLYPRRSLRQTLELSTRPVGQPA
jgi:hypothetical protein